MKHSPFQFTNPKVKNIEFHVNDDFDKESFDGFNINNNIEKYIIEEGKIAIVALETSIGVDQEGAPFYIKVKIVARFKGEDMSLDKFNQCLDTNAPAALLSYVRPIVANLTVQSGFPALNIPFMNFVED